MRAPRGNSAAVDECGLSRSGTARPNQEGQAFQALERIGVVQGEALEQFALDAKVAEPPPFEELLVEAFLETAFTVAIGGVAGTLTRILMARVTPLLEANAAQVGAIGLAAMGSMIEDAVKDGLAGGAQEARSASVVNTPAYFELDSLVLGLKHAMNKAWYQGGMEFLNQVSGLTDEDLCTLLEAVQGMQEEAKHVQYAAAASAWARYLGEAKGRPPSVGATQGHSAERLISGETDADALEIANSRGGVPEMGFDPNLMLQVEVVVSRPYEAALAELRWPGMPPLVCEKLAGVPIRQLSVPIRVSSRNGIAFDLDPEGRVFRNLSSGEGRAILRAMGQGRAENWAPGMEDQGAVPGQSPDRAAVDQGAMALAHGWILPHQLEAGAIES